MKPAENKFIAGAKTLLEAVAAEKGWQIEANDPELHWEQTYARVWPTKHVGISLELRGHSDSAGFRPILKTCLSGGLGAAYTYVTKAWRRLTGIPVEDRRTILEFAATFSGREALIIAEEYARAEALKKQERRREALRARTEAFKARTGQELWVNQFGPPEARDEPYRAGYVRPKSWIRSISVTPGAAKFVIEVPDENTNIERLFLAVQEIETLMIK